MSNNPSPGRLSRVPTLAPSSPKRQPLAQRTQSQTNSANSSTVRLVVEDPKAVYEKSPFPALPSQVLSPGRLKPQRYAPFVDRDRGVSEEDLLANSSPTKHVEHEALVPKPLHLRRPNRVSTSTDISDADTSTLTATTLHTADSLFTPSSSRQSSHTSPPSSFIEEFENESWGTRLEPVHEEIASRCAISKPESRPTIRAIPPSPANDRLPLNYKTSEASLASSSSSDTLPDRLRYEDQILTSPSSGNFQVYPHTSSEISLVATREQEPAHQVVGPSGHIRPFHEFISLESVVLSDIEYLPSDADRPQSAYLSAPSSSHDSATPTQENASVQYPVIKRIPTSSSYAEVSSQSEPVQSKVLMHEEIIRPMPWSTRLSTIASESDQSHSHSTSTDSRRFGRRRRTIGSGEHMSVLSGESEWEYGSGVLTGSVSQVSLPIPQPFYQPRPLPVVHDDIHLETLHPDEQADEQDDTLGELQVPPLRKQRSGALTRFSSKSSLRPSSADSAMSHGSSISFIGDLQWARRYYSNGEPANMIAAARTGSFKSPVSSPPTTRMNTAQSGLTTSPVSDTVPANLHRPRNRPREGKGKGKGKEPERRPRQENRRVHRPFRARHSVSITEEDAVESVQGPLKRRTRSFSAPVQSVSEMMWSPHLRRDQRHTVRYSAWAAPSLEEPLGRSMFGPENRQVVCFALGFLLPFIWWIGAILPLPKRPEPAPEADASRHDSAIFDNDASANMSDFSLKDKRWQKARWWRRVNRILSVFGLLIIAAVIALAIIATKKSTTTATASRPYIVPS